MKKFMLLMIFIVVACSPHTSKIQTGDYIGNHEKWEKSDIVRVKLIAISDDVNDLEEYFFCDDGDVMAILGRLDGLIAGPSFHWEIDEDGILLMIRSDEIRLKIMKMGERDGLIIGQCKRGNEESWKACKFKKE